MDRITINLLPKHVIEKRNFERRLAYVLLGVGIVAAILVTIYGANLVRIVGEERELQALEAENLRYQQAIGQIQGYENARLAVEQREKLVTAATADKFAWSKLLNNISLLIPNDVWLDSFAGDGGKGLSFSGQATPFSGNTDTGYKPIAKWLVRLGELKGVEDIWLSQTQKGGEGESANVQWQVSAKLKTPESASAVSAPPTASGGGTGQ